jgi:hypothetical protein
MRASTAKKMSLKVKTRSLPRELFLFTRPQDLATTLVADLSPSVRSWKMLIESASIWKSRAWNCHYILYSIVNASSECLVTANLAANLPRMEKNKDRSTLSIF